MSVSNTQGVADENEQGCTQSPKIRHDWYQTDTHVILNILAKKMKETDVDIKYEIDSLKVSFPLDRGTEYCLSVKLAHEINPSQCSAKVLPSKIEIKLKKKEGFRWTTLEEVAAAKKDVKQIPLESTAPCEASAPKYPSSSQKQKDWDKVVTDITKSEEDKPEGEAALNALFQKIYSEGSDEVRKAMNKSFVESGGTVLSTNWGEVRRDKVDVKPPDGMEWKKWDA